MPSDPNRVDLIVQFALLVAGEQDEYFDRQLGPIHLIKYAYLADLAYARRNGGESFTGTEWQFYKFGPWANSVYERISPALATIGAEERRFQSDYGEDDWVRYSFQSDDILRERERALPGEITFSLRSDIRRFGKDTAALLDYVYRTAPMLAAAPNEILDLTHEANAGALRAEKVVPSIEHLSKGKRKRFVERISNLRARKKRAKYTLINPVRIPHDERVLQEGIAWLDRLAGDAPASGEYSAEFSDDIWKSDARKGPGVS